MEANPYSIVSLSFDVPDAVGQKPESAQELAIAKADLLLDNSFQLEGHGEQGPYAVAIRPQDGRLIFSIQTQAGDTLADIGVGIADFRAILRDYLMICDSWHEARRGINLSRVETIDMARRGLHDEGARLLAERLAAAKPAILIDHPTARQLFTIVGLLLAPYSGEGR